MSNKIQAKFEKNMKKNNYFLTLRYPTSSLSTSATVIFTGFKLRRHKEKKPFANHKNLENSTIIEIHCQGKSFLF